MYIFLSLEPKEQSNNCNNEPAVFLKKDRALMKTEHAWGIE